MFLFFESMTFGHRCKIVKNNCFYTDKFQLQIRCRLRFLSPFYNGQFHGRHVELVGFGTACLMTDEQDWEVVRWLREEKDVVREEEDGER